MDIRPRADISVVLGQGGLITGVDDVDIELEEVRSKLQEARRRIANGEPPRVILSNLNDAIKILTILIGAMALTDDEEFPHKE
jgi:hypothetical protein